MEPSDGSGRDEPAVDAGRLREAGAHGVKWSLAQTIGGQLARLAFTFVLVRLVGPSNFGIVAQATIYVGLTQVVMDQGFGAALVQRKVLHDRDVGTVTWLNLASGVVLAGLTVAVAPQIAAFFDTPELVAVLRVLSISRVLQSFQLVPKALIRRRFLFRGQTIVELVAVGVSGVAGIAAALGGADYWSLVVQTLVYDVVVLVGLNRLVWALRSFRGARTNLRSLWAFSAGLLGSRFLVFFGQNIDNVLIGRFESARQLAYYALSYRLLRLPLQMIGGVANTVSLPIFARLQDDDERLRSWFLRSTGLVSLVAFPALALLVVGAVDGVPLVFGSEWRPAVRPLQILCAAGAIDVVRMLMSPVAQAKERTDLVFWWSLITFGTQGVAFAIGIHWGIVGVATAYALTTVIITPANVAHFGRRVITMSLRDYGRALAPASVGSVVLAATWLGVNDVLAGFDVHGLARLPMATVGALGVYVAALRILFPAALLSAIDVGRLMARRSGE